MRQMYAKSLLQLYKAVLGSTPSQPLSINQVLSFKAYLHLNGLAASTIRTKLSAVSFWHQINQWTNPVDHFLVQKSLIGAANLSTPAPTSRFPVSPPLLLHILMALNSINLDGYATMLFTAVFTLAFFAFLRVVEYTFSPHCLSISDVVIMGNSLKLAFQSHKHSSHKVQCILLPSVVSQSCPDAALRTYVLVRPKLQGPLFIWNNGVTLSANEVRKELRQVAKVLSLLQGSLTLHSFCIGAATTAASLGISDEVIAKMGCWSSKAYLAHIHCSVNRL